MSLQDGGGTAGELHVGSQSTSVRRHHALLHGRRDSGVSYIITSHNASGTRQGLLLQQRDGWPGRGTGTGLGAQECKS